MRPSSQASAYRRRIFTGAYGNAETIAFLARVVADGAPQPTVPHKALVDGFISALKVGAISGANILAKCDVIVLPMHAALAWQNLKADAFNPSVGASAPVFQNGGYTTDGVDDWINTNFNASTAGGSYTQNSAHAWIYLRDSDADDDPAFGWWDGTDGLRFSPREAADSCRWRINQAAADFAPANTNGSGLWALNRSTSTAIQLYREGASIDTGTTVSTALNNANFRLGCADAASFSSHDIPGYGFGGSLTGNEHADLENAFAAYRVGFDAL